MLRNFIFVSLKYLNCRHYSSLEVAAEYFRSGADKISIGSDAVYAAEEYLRTGVWNSAYCLFLMISSKNRAISDVAMTVILGKNREDQLRADIKSLWESGKLTANGHVYFYIFPLIHVNTST